MYVHWMKQHAERISFPHWSMHSGKDFHCAERDKQIGMILAKRRRTRLGNHDDDDVKWWAGRTRDIFHVSARWEDKDLCWQEISHSSLLFLLINDTWEEGKTCGLSNRRISSVTTETLISMKNPSIFLVILAAAMPSITSFDLPAEIHIGRTFAFVWFMPIIPSCRSDIRPGRYTLSSGLRVCRG